MDTCSLYNKNFIFICLQHTISEPFEPSPFIPGNTKVFEEDFDMPVGWQPREQTDAEASVSFPTNEKEISGRENNVAKIKVVVC